MITLSALVATALAECVIHEVDHVYYNISDLGLAVFDNRVADVDDLVAGGCDVNYNGTSKLFVYSYSENEYEYGDYLNILMKLLNIRIFQKEKVQRDIVWTIICARILQIKF